MRKWIIDGDKLNNKPSNPVDHEAGGSPETAPGERAPELLLLSADGDSVVGGDADFPISNKLHQGAAWSC